MPPLLEHNKTEAILSEPIQQDRRVYPFTAGPYQINLGCTTKIMAIVNATPDSFSQDGCYKTGINISKAVDFCREQSRRGADIIDIGGESSRPGADQISVQEEIERVVPVVRQLNRSFDKPISIDTYKPDVAKAALDAGATIVNNIMGTSPETALLKMIGRYDAAIVLMHIRGTPRTMQEDIYYDDLIGEITGLLRNSIEKCLECGIKSDRIIVDPGIGFGKTVEHNLKILKRMKDLHVLGKPVLVGTSRKSFIGKILDSHVDDRLAGTIATISAAILNGAHIIRVHDVKPAKQAAKVADAILNS